MFRASPTWQERREERLTGPASGGPQDLRRGRGDTSLLQTRGSLAPAGARQGGLPRAHAPGPTARGRGFWPLWSVALALCGVGCLQDVSGEAIPASARLYYPSQLALSSDGRSAFVVSTNFDQRFNAAWLTQVDVPALVAARDDAQAAAAALHQGPHVASLGGPLVLSRDGRRAYLAHRGLGLLTAFDVAPGEGEGGSDAWRCGGGARGNLSNRLRKTDCDEAHVLDVRMATAARLGLADEPGRDDFLDPFALLPLADGQLGVGFLNTHRLAKVPAGLPLDVGEVLAAPRAARLDDAALAGDTLVAAGHTGSDEDGGGGESLLVAWPDAAATPVQTLPSRAMGQNPDRGERGPSLTRLLAAPGDDGRLFALGRRPDTLSVVRLRTAPQSQVQNDVVTVSPLPATPTVTHTEVLPEQTLSALAYLARPSGALLVASSFARDTLYFFADLGDRLALVHRMRLPAGRGPAAMLPVTVEDRTYLLVSTFFDHGLTLLDVSSDNVSDFRLQARVQDGQFSAQTRAR